MRVLLLPLLRCVLPQEKLLQERAEFRRSLQRSSSNYAKAQRMKEAIMLEEAQQKQQAEAAKKQEQYLKHKVPSVVAIACSRTVPGPGSFCSVPVCFLVVSLPLTKPLFETALLCACYAVCDALLTMMSRFHFAVTVAGCCSKGACVCLWCACRQRFWRKRRRFESCTTSELLYHFSRLCCSARRR